MGACFGKCLANRKDFSFRFRTSNNDRHNLVDENKPDDESFVFRIMKTKSKKQSKFIDRFWSRSEINNYSRLNRNINISGSDIQLQCLDAHSLLLTTRDKFSTNQPDLYTGLTSSPAGSSLDLEWEHEYGNEQNQSWLALTEEATTNDLSSEDDCSSNHSELHKQTKRHKNFQTTNSNNSDKNKIYNRSRTQYNNNRIQNNITSNSSVTSWSHISTPDSLEWDVGQDNEQFKSEDSLDQETKELLFEIEQLKNRVLSETGINLMQSNEDEVES